MHCAIKFNMTLLHYGWLVVLDAFQLQFKLRKSPFVLQYSLWFVQKRMWCDNVDLSKFQSFSWHVRQYNYLLLNDLEFNCIRGTGSSKTSMLLEITYQLCIYLLSNRMGDPESFFWENVLTTGFMIFRCIHVFISTGRERLIRTQLIRSST